VEALDRGLEDLAVVDQLRRLSRFGTAAP
jgi:hypothetical protein